MCRYNYYTSDTCVITYSVQSSRRTQNLLENSLFVFAWAITFHFVFYFPLLCRFLIVEHTISRKTCVKRNDSTGDILLQCAVKSRLFQVATFVISRSCEFKLFEFSITLHYAIFERKISLAKIQ